MSGFYDGMIFVFADWMQLWLVLLVVAYLFAAFGVMMLTMMRSIIRPWL